MISQTSEYALRAIVHLAALPAGATAAASDIADATRIPVGYLQKIMRTLARHGILRAQRGVGGGFTLARDPGAISILDVLTAADAPIQRIERCPLGIKGHTDLCPLHRLLDEQMARAECAFASTTVADLLASGGSTVAQALCAARKPPSGRPKARR